MRGNQVEGRGYNLLAQGYNQGYNQNGKVITENLVNLAQGYNQNDDIFLSRKEVQELLNISQPAIIKAIKSGRFKAILVHGNGGLQYRIALSSLPSPAQVKWVQSHPEQALSLPEYIIDKLSPEAQFEIMKMKAPKEELGMDTIVRVQKNEKLQKDIELIQKAIAVPKGWKKSKWIEKVAEEAGITKQALYKKIRVYQEKGIRGLRARDNSHLKKWSPEALQFLQGVYLRMIKEGGNASKKRAYEAVLAEAEKRGWKVGSQSSAYMYLSQLNPLLEKYARAGTRGLDNVFYIMRRYDDLEPLECIVGDQHRFDFWVEDKETGRVFRPEGYFWVDLRTRLCYGFAIADRYNAYLMGLALRMGFKTFGKFKVAYTDNGKPEVSKYFNSIIKELHQFGMDEQDIAELYRTDNGYAVEDEEGQVIDIVTTKEAWHRYARPYNAKAKPVEAFFNTMEKLLLDLGVPGLIRELRGTSDEKAQDDKRLKALREQGKLLSFDEFLQKVFEAVEIYNKRRHSALKASPLETFMKLVKEGFAPRYIVEKELDFILMKREIRSVNRGRILLDGVWYEGEDLENGLWDVPDKTRVEVRYDPYERGSVYAIRPDRIVELREVPISSMKNKEKTAELMEWKRSMMKKVRELYQKITAQAKGVIEYSKLTRQVIEAEKRRKQKKPVVIDPEQIRREVEEKKRLTLEAEQKRYQREFQFQRKTIFTNQRERYQYLVECELNGIEITAQDREFMKWYEAQMDETERIWFKNFRKYYQYERRGLCMGA
jgi:putative transposase